MSWPRCECKHPAQWHHQFGTNPCGSGSCECRAYVAVVGVLREPEPWLVPNLFGELQPAPVAE